MVNEIPKILIVDDERVNINVLGSILQEYDVRVALNGEQALHLIAMEPCLDMVLLDVQMPGIDGYEVCQRLKAKPETKDIPVIFVTTYCEEKDEMKGLQLGAVDYITKPFRESIVKVRLKNHLDLKRQRDLLNHQSSHDGLTGIPNRSRFEEYLESEWYRAIRTKCPLSLILADIDQFKKYNDYYGHVAGDECLRKVGQKLNESLERAFDLAARYGGEEFAVILPHTNLRGAIYVAEKIYKNIYDLSIPHAHSVVSPFLTVSMGVAEFAPDLMRKPAELITAADQMLYKAKNSGRNQIMA